MPTALSLGNLADLVAFMKKRMTIKDCPQRVAAEGDSWYMTDDVPHGTICQACYEDSIASTAFAHRYNLRKPQGASFCDSSVWLVRMMFIKHVKNNNWDTFAKECVARFQIPMCPGLNSVKAGERQWFGVVDGSSELQVCGACYADFFYNTPDQSRLREVKRGDGDAQCDMGGLNILVPMHHAISRKDRSIFWKALNGLEKYPYCSPQGVKNTAWYTTAGDPPGFAICGACYEGLVKTIGGVRFFTPKTGIPSNEARLCSFNMTHARGPSLLQNWDQARSLGDPKFLEDYAAKWANVPKCQGRAQLKRRQWWGWGVVSICEECYISFAKGTALEARFAMRDHFKEGERMCDLFSPRMRGLYTQACESGDLDTFLAMAEQRHIIYTQTIMQCEEIINQQKIAAMKSQMLGIQGSFYKNLGWSQDVTMGHNYTVGNSYVGYGHANEHVAQGYAYDRQAREMGATVGGGSYLQVGLLEARWKEVE